MVKTTNSRKLATSAVLQALDISLGCYIIPAKRVQVVLGDEMSNTVEEGVKKIRDCIGTSLDSKNIPPGKVRAIDKNILRLHLMGAKYDDIAKELGLDKCAVANALKNPEVVREIERLDILTDKELLQLTTASKRRMLEAALDAADELVELMGGEHTPGIRLKAIIKVLEYAHGKPHQSIAISADGLKPLSDGDEKILDDMISVGSNGE